MRRHHTKKTHEPQSSPASMAGPQTEVHRFCRTDREEIRASVGLFRGRILIHLRTWEMRATGMRPTTRGIAVGMEQLEELEKAIKALRPAVETYGQLEVAEQPVADWSAGGAIPIQS